MATHKKDFRLFDPSLLIPLWRDFYPAKYRISNDLFHQNTVDSPLFDWGASSAAFEEGKPVAFIAVKRPASRLYRGPDPDTMHINSLAFRDPETAVDLMADVKKVLRSRGSSHVVFGQDSRHFFPGCPMDAPALKSFLMVEGFIDKGICSDLEANLEDYVNPAKPTENGEYRPLLEVHRKSLLSFFEKSFPGRWRHDVLDKAAMEGISNTVYGLLINDEVKGFALVQTENHRRPIGGAVWREDLGPAWGSLGPIGVAADIRGRGYGNRLLGEALTHLKNSGVKRCIIDWTTLVDFYAKHGFEVTREYQSMELSLQPS